MPSRLRLASLGLASPVTMGHGWYNSGSSNHPNPAGSGAASHMVIEQMFIGGIEPTSLGGDTLHRVAKHDGLTPNYFQIVVGAPANYGHCIAYRPRIRVDTGAYAGNGGTTELFWNIFTRMV